MTKDDLRNYLCEQGAGHALDQQIRRYLVELPGHAPTVTAEEIGQVQRELVAELRK